MQSCTFATRSYALRIAFFSFVLSNSVPALNAVRHACHAAARHALDAVRQNRANNANRASSIAGVTALVLGADALLTATAADVAVAAAMTDVVVLLSPPAAATDALVVVVLLVSLTLLPMTAGVVADGGAVSGFSAIFSNKLPIVI